MKKILIALDYDHTAQEVAETGFAMAKSMKADIVLLHVISDPVYYSSSDYSPIVGFTGNMEMDQIEFGSAEGLVRASAQYLDKIRHHLGDNNIQILVKEGEFAETIIEVAKNINADIIALGSHGRRWMEEILLGSVTEKVLHQTTIPLFIIPTKKQHE
jgi:nucleotide-binding universal stress UspA family protein